MSQRALTPPRRRALFAVGANPNFALESNLTDAGRGLVHWQSLRWLVAEGLVCSDHELDGRPVFRLTEKGEHLVLRAAEVWE